MDIDNQPLEEMEQHLDELRQELLQLHPRTPGDHRPPTTAAAPLNHSLHSEAPPPQGRSGVHQQQQQEQEMSVQPVAPAADQAGAATAGRVSWLPNPASASPAPTAPSPAAVDSTAAETDAAPSTSPMSSRSRRATIDNADNTTQSQLPVPATAAAAPVAAAAAADPVPAAATAPAVIDDHMPPTADASLKHDVATADKAYAAAAQASADMAFNPPAVGGPGAKVQHHNATTAPAGDEPPQSNSPDQATITPEAAAGELPAGSAAPAASAAATAAAEAAAQSNAADVASPPPAAVAAATGAGSGRKRGKKHPKQPPPGAKAQLKGVFWDRKTGRWRSQLGYHNKKIFMGYYNTPQEAAVAYDKKAVELHGMLAKTNFPIHDYVQLLPEGASPLPTPEMAIPQGKKQQPDTSAGAAAAADMSLESEGVAGASDNGGTTLSGGPTAAGDAAMLGADSQQQQQQQQGPEGSGAKGAGGSWQPLAAAAAVPVGDGGIDVPVIPAEGAAAAAEGGSRPQAAAGRPLRSMRKLTAASRDLSSKALDIAAAADDSPTDAGNTAMDRVAYGQAAADRAETILVQPSRQQQKRPFTRGGSSRGRDRQGVGVEADPGEIRGPRTRGRPRSANYQGLSGWPGSPEAEGDQQSPQPGYDTQRNRRDSYYHDEGLDGSGYQTPAYHNTGYRPRGNKGLIRSSTSGGRGVGAVQGYSESDQLEGFGSADLTAAQAIASLMQLGAADPEPEDLQKHFSWQQQQQQQPELQDYEGGRGARSAGRMVSGVRGGYYTGFSGEPKEYWADDQMDHDAQHGPWQQQQQRQQRSKYGNGVPANGPNWQQLGFDSSGNRYGNKPYSQNMLPSTAAAAAAIAGWQQQYGSDAGENDGLHSTAAAAAQGCSLPGDRLPAHRSSARGSYPSAAPSGKRAWQRQHDEDDTSLLQHAAALAALPRLSPTAASAPPSTPPALDDQVLGLNYDDLLQLVQSALAAADSDTHHHQQQQQQQRERSGRDSRELALIQQLQEVLVRLHGDQHNVRPSAAAAPPHHQQHQSHTAAAAAGTRSEAQDTVISLLTAVLSPPAAPAAAVTRPTPRYHSASATAAHHSPPAPALPAAAAARADVPSSNDLALIDEALLLLPPDQQDLINQHPSLKLLLAKVVGGGHSGTPAAARQMETPQQQQQQQEEEEQENSQQHGSYTRYHRVQRNQSLPQYDMFKQPQACTPTAAAGGGILAHTPTSNVSASARSPTNHQPFASSAPRSHHHRPLGSLAANTLPQATGVKRSPIGHVMRGRGTNSRGAFHRGAAGIAKPASVVNPGGVTFRKGKALRRWGSQGMSPTSPGSGRGSSLRLPGPVGSSPPTPAAAAAAAAAGGGGSGGHLGSSSSSPIFSRSSRLLQATQHLQLPQLVPLPEMSQPAAVQQQQQQPAEQQQQHGEEGDSNLEGLIAALVKALKPGSSTAAAAAEDGGVYQYPDAADFEPPSKRSKLSPSTFTPVHRLESSRESKPGRGPIPAAVNPLLGPFTPAPSISAPQQAGHFIYTPPGACQLASPAAEQSVDIGASAATADAGGDIVMHQAVHPDLDRDDEAVDVMVHPALSFSQWEPAATSQAPGLQPPPPPTAAAREVQPIVVDPTQLLQAAITALQAPTGSATALAVSMPPLAAAAAPQAAVTVQQQQMLQDHGLQLHVLPPHGMLLPGQLRELQAAAAGSSSSSAAHLTWLAGPAALLSAVEGLSTLLSEGEGVTQDIWDNIARNLGTADGLRRGVTPAAAVAGGGEPVESLGTDVQQGGDADMAVKVHLEVVQGNSSQQQQRKRPHGHLMLLPVVIPVVAAAAAAKPEAPLTAAEVASAAISPTHDEPEQQQQQQQNAELPIELAQLPPALRLKVSELRDQVAAMQGGILTPEQDTNWLLRRMVAAARRKVEARQQLLQQREPQQSSVEHHQQQPLIGTANNNEPTYVNLDAPSMLTATAAAAVSAGVAPSGRGSSVAGGGRTITTGIDSTTVSNLQQLLARAAAGLR